MGERLPYKQRVTGSSPVSSIFYLTRECGSALPCYADMAELADAQDLGSCVFVTWRFESSYPHRKPNKTLFKLLKRKMKKSVDR